MREAVDVLFAFAALIVAAGFAPDSVSRRQLALAVVVCLAAFTGWRAWHHASAAPSPASDANGPIAPNLPGAAPRGVPIVCAGGLARDASAAVGALDDARVVGTERALHDHDAVRRDAALVFRGWVADFAGDAPAASACLLIDGRVDGRASGEYGASRPDVARALGHASLDGSGYVLRFAAARLAPGAHRFTVVAVTGSRYRALSKSIALRIER